MKQIKSEYKIAIRDSQGKYLNFLWEYISFTAKIVLNDIGMWRITGKSTEECPIKPGYGIIVYRNDVFFYSGYLTKSEAKYEHNTKTWNWTASGYSDLGYLKYRVIYPTSRPTSSFEIADRYRIADVNEYCTREASNLINDNLGKNAAAERNGGLEFASAIIRGDWNEEAKVGIPQKYRYSNLYSAVKDLIEKAKARIVPIWNDNKLVFEISVKPDVSENVRFIAASDQVISLSHVMQIPDCNCLISSSNLDIVNDFEAPPAEIVRAQFWKYYCSSGSYQLNWGRVENYFEADTEMFKDTEDERYEYDITWEKLYEITNEEIKNIANKNNTDGYEIEISNEITSLKYKENFEIGDTVGIVLPDGNIYKAEVTEVNIQISYGQEKLSCKTSISNKNFLYKIKSDVSKLDADYEKRTTTNEKTIKVNTNPNL